jgi:hypothetical protein
VAAVSLALSPKDASEAAARFKMHVFFSLDARLFFKSMEFKIWRGSCLAWWDYPQQYLDGGILWEFFFIPLTAGKSMKDMKGEIFDGFKSFP